MTWGFELLVHLPHGRRIAGSNGDAWTMPEPVGVITVSGKGEPLDKSTEVTFRGAGYATDVAARTAGELFTDWARAASALHSLGLDVGPDRVTSQLGLAVADDVSAQLAPGAFHIDDVHGLVVYEERGQPVRFSARASGVVSLTSGTLLQEFLDAARVGPLSPISRLACDLVSMAEHETRVGSSFLMLVTAMEVMAVRHDRSATILTLLDRWRDDAKTARKAASPADIEAYNSLLSSLDDLRTTSIGQSIRDLATRARPCDPQVTQLASRIYTCRSQLIHSGSSGDSPESMFGPARDLARDMIRIFL